MSAGSTPLAGDSEVDTLLFSDTAGATSRAEVVEVSLFSVDISIYFLPVSSDIKKKTCIVKSTYSMCNYIYSPIYKEILFLFTWKNSLTFELLGGGGGGGGSLTAFTCHRSIWGKLQIKNNNSKLHCDNH